MEVLCPECQGPLVTTDGEWAQCTLHGGRYRILFLRGELPRPAGSPAPAAAMPPPAPPPPTEAPLPPGKILTRCPSCGQQFRVGAQSVGKQAQCTSCKLYFQIVALPAPPPAAPAPPAWAAPAGRAGAAAPSAPPGVQAPAAAMCAGHPHVPAVYACSRCRKPICATCGFPQADGSQWCPDCATARAASGAEHMRAPGGIVGQDSSAIIGLGLVCAHHPAVRAVRRCRVCRTPICATCDFVFPGGVHLCPTCATSPERKMSSKRKGLIGWAYGLAIWGTVGIVLLVSGAFAGSVRTREELQTLGVAIEFLVFLPALVGTGLSVAAFDRRLSNPPVVWVAAIWNGILLAALLILKLIGTFSG